MTELPRPSNVDVPPHLRGSSSPERWAEFCRGLSVGQVWQHKRERRRRVEILDVWTRGDGIDLVEVRRNTSRRRQPISVATLRRDYELTITDARAARDA